MAEQPLKGMELQEKEEDKYKKHINFNRRSKKYVAVNSSHLDFKSNKTHFTGKAR